jgi:DNA adenine methylase
MRYVGGKTRISKWVADNVRLLGGTRPIYLEPFVGSGACFVKLSPTFQEVIASDAHTDLIMMWKALAEGWVPPAHVSREEYFLLKTSEPSALRGFVGFGASFSGKWFGGYVDTAWDAHWNRFTKSYLGAARESVLKAAPFFKRATIIHSDYRKHQVDDRTVVYCDPPYDGTLGYGGTAKFGSGEFWTVAEAWSNAGAVVIVSESKAPEGWRAHATRERKAMLKVSVGVENDVRQESIFVRA